MQQSCWLIILSMAGLELDAVAGSEACGMAGDARPEAVIVHLETASEADAESTLSCGDSGDSEFLVRLERPSVDSCLGLGLSCTPHACGEVLRVVRIKDGLISHWNAHNKAHVVKKGDSIVGVNGVTGTAAELLSIIKVAHGQLELQVRRFTRCFEDPEAGNNGQGEGTVGFGCQDTVERSPSILDTCHRPWGVGLEPAVEERAASVGQEYLRHSPLAPLAGHPGQVSSYPAPPPLFPAPSPPSVGLRMAAGSPGGEAEIRIEMSDDSNGQVAHVDNRFVYGLVHALLLGNAGKPQGVLLCAQGSAMEHIFIALSLACQVYLLYMLFEGTADSQGPHNNILCGVCLTIFGAAVAEAFYPAYMHQKQVVSGMCFEWNKCRQCCGMWLIFADLCVFSATLIFGSRTIIASEDTKDMVIDTLAAMFIPDIDNLFGRVAYTMHRSAGGAVDVPASAVLPFVEGYEEDSRTPQDIAALGIASRLIRLRGFAGFRCASLLLTDPSWRPLLRLGGIIVCAFCLWGIDRTDVHWALPTLAITCLAHLFFTVSRRASESFLASLVVMAFPAATVVLQFWGSKYILDTSGSLPATVIFVALLQFIALCFLHLVSKAKDESSFWWLGSPMVALSFWLMGSIGAGACIVWLSVDSGLISMADL